MRFVNTKTLILLGIIVILLLLIKNIVSSIVTLRQNSRIVTELEEREKEELQRREFLKQQLHFSNTQEFIESQAREKLGMVKPGEHIVLMPPQEVENEEEIKIDTTPNWKKWWNLFF
jgi:cell division protein FtsB